MASQDDSELARKVLEHDLASAEELKQCEAQQAGLRKEGVEKTLARILVEAGYMTKSQLRRLSGSTDDSMSRPAEQIPGFKILGKIGQGAMASVYKAKQLDMGRVVAVKVLPKRLSENREFMERFYRQGQIVARLNHSNIVQAVDLREAGGYHYFVMEYIEGKTVFDDLADMAPYSEKDAVNIVLQVASALEHAHERGFIHRDVKPKSIMLTWGKHVKLINWDLAREAGDFTAAKSEAGQAVGTPYYMSPEQIHGEMNVDFRTDIYALGATLYHMLTGRRPFEGATPSAVMHKHLKLPLVPPDQLNPELSSGVGELVERMMEKDREERYASTGELVAALEGLLQGKRMPPRRQRLSREVLKELGGTDATARVAGPTKAKPPKFTAVDAFAGLAGSAVAVVGISYALTRLSPSFVEDVLSSWPVYVAVAAVLGIAGAAFVIRRRRRRNDKRP